jgi:hypothetical protein
VSIWMYCCSGCLRPPCGGMLATVPSSIFSRACCTPSPLTSRVMLTLFWRFADLVDFVDVDDAALGGFQIVIGVLQQLQQNVFDVFADVAGFGKRRGVADGEGHIENARQRLGQQRFAAAGRADQQHVALVDFDFIADRRRRGSGVPIVRIGRGGGRLGGAQSLVMIVHGDRQRLLGVLLADDILIQEFLDLPRAGNGVNSGWLLLVSLRFSWRMML